MQIVTVTAEELKGMITDAVESALKINVKDSIQDPQIVDGTYLIEKLGITRQTLTNWRNKNKIPFIKQGGIIRYDFNKVIEFLESKKGKTSI